jgi:hypothetical protein
MSEDGKEMGISPQIAIQSHEIATKPTGKQAS